MSADDDTTTPLIFLLLLLLLLLRNQIVPGDVSSLADSDHWSGVCANDRAAVSGRSVLGCVLQNAEQKKQAAKSAVLMSILSAPLSRLHGSPGPKNILDG